MENVLVDPRRPPPPPQREGGGGGRRGTTGTFQIFNKILNSRKVVKKYFFRWSGGDVVKPPGDLGGGGASRNHQDVFHHPSVQAERALSAGQGAGRGERIVLFPVRMPAFPPIDACQNFPRALKSPPPSPPPKKKKKRDVSKVMARTSVLRKCTRFRRQVALHGTTNDKELWATVRQFEALWSLRAAGEHWWH